MGIFGMLPFRKIKAARRLAEEIELLHNSPLLDPVWYRQNYSDLGDSPIDVARHYLEHGAAVGRNPGPLFDTKFYLEQNPDVVASGMNPLIRCVRHGRRAEAYPVDSGDGHSRSSGRFDVRWRSMKSAVSKDR